MTADRFIPYGCQQIDEDDIAAVVEVLRSDWLTTGPMVERFEQAIAEYVGCRYAVAVSSGTAALHAAMFALGIGPGDEVIVPSLTFVATVNAVMYQQGIPVFTDVGDTDLLICPKRIEEKITSRTKAIIVVDYSGHPCDYSALRALSDCYNIPLVADATHSLGASYRDRKVGSLADLTIFSFHPIKPITTGEGGMIVTADNDLAARMRKFRNHGIENDHRVRRERGIWQYEMDELGYNYRLNDIQSALGLSQLQKVDSWVTRRQQVASEYLQRFSTLSEVRMLNVSPHVSHGYHLFIIRSDRRDHLFHSLRQADIGCNVHYPPVHLQPYYRRVLGCGSGDCPVSEVASESILSLPIFPGMREYDVDRVFNAVAGALHS